MKISIKNIIKNKIFGDCSVNGWVKTKRDSKIGISFIQINDGSCLGNLQLVAKSNLLNYDQILKLTPGCAVTVKGKLVKSIGKKQSVELQVISISLLNLIKNPSVYPIQPKFHTLDYLRGLPHLRQRTKTFGSINRVRSKLSYLFHKFFYENDFELINTPIITSNDCEGGGSLFSINNKNKENFFNEEAYLTVSGQLHLESFALSLSNVYTFGPTFRAENSNTSRHLAEFWMLEAEIAFYGIDEIVIFVENMVKNILKNIFIECEEDILYLNKRDKHGYKNDIESIKNCTLERLSYTEAINILKKNSKKFEYNIEWGMDLQSEHEAFLSEVVYKTPIIILDYPKKIKSFYMKGNEEDRTVKSFDVIFPGIGEVIGGSEREDNYELLKNNIEKHGIKSKIDWYADLRKFGSTPHSGFGLGLERFMSYITGISNVRDLVAFPRTTGNIRG